MKLSAQTENELSFANYYAVELLESYFGNSEPEETAILNLEKQLTSTQVKNYLQVKKKKNVFKALILSPEALELNTLTLMLYSKGIDVEHISTKEELFNHFSQKSYYNLVVVSENFRCIGINFLSLYFRSLKLRPYLIYLGDDTDSHYGKIGFDAHLQHPFLTQYLTKILPKFKNIII